MPLPSEDDLLDDYIAGMLADLESVRRRWFSGVKVRMLSELRITPVNRTFDERTQPDRDRIALPPRFLDDEFNGVTAECFVLAWQFQCFTDFAINQEYLAGEDLQRFLGRAVMNVGDSKEIPAMVDSMSDPPITVDDVAVTLAAFLVNTSGENVAFIKVHDMLERVMLPFLGELTRMKAALAFSDFTTASAIAERFDPKRRW